MRIGYPAKKSPINDIFIYKIMKRKLIKEQADTQVNTEFDKKPGMTSYASTPTTSTDSKGSGTSTTPEPAAEKKTSRMKLPVDLLSARSLKKKNAEGKEIAACPRLQGTMYITPKGGGDGVLRKEAKEDSKNPDGNPTGLYSAGDTIYYKNDGTFDVFTKDKKLKKGNRWTCKALIEGGDQPKPTPEPSPSPEPGKKRTKDQLDFIRDELKTKGRVEACNDIDIPEPEFSARCATLSSIASNTFLRTDLSDVIPEVFPKKGDKILYTQRAGNQQVSANTTNQKIEYYRRKGWKKSDEIDMGEDYKYLPHNLRELEPRVFATDYYMYELRTDVSCDKLIKRMSDPDEGKIEFGTISRGDCRKAVDTFYSIYIQNCDMEPTLKEKYKRYIKQCRSNKNFGKRIDSVMNQLTNISKNDPNPRKRSFSLAESVKPVTLKESINYKLKEIKKLKESVKTRNKNLKFSIRENLLNIQENQRIQKLESEIMKNRIDFVVESYLKTKKVDHLLRDIIYEYNYMSKQNFGKKVLKEEKTNDNLLNYLSKKIPNATEMLVGKMVNDIAKKMDGNSDSWWVNRVTNEFKKDTELNPEKMLELDCDYIVSKFSDTFENILKSKKSGSFMGEPDDLTSFMKDSLDYAIDNSFRSDFERKLKSKICPILDSYMTKMKDTEEMLNKKLVSRKPSED